MTTPRKFRVWDGEEMHEPPHKFLLDSTGTVCWNGREAFEEDIAGEYEPLFYTSLTDAEGAEIWEGDVVEHNYADELEVVRWSDWYPGFDLRNVHQDAVPNALQTGTVVGNRYENPNLLKETAAQ